MGSELINSYAVVTYIDGDLARFVESFRREVTPSCTHRAHLTILPPRPLSVPAEEAIAELREAASKFQPFEVGMGAVGLFESTGVVKLSVARGLNELRTLHEVLNTGSLKLVEPYKYTPHVTLCMDVEGRSPDELMAAAGPRWSAYEGEAGFIADRLTFVQQRADETWVDLVEVAVGEPKPIAVRR